MIDRRQPELWIHGHVHQPFDYGVEPLEGAPTRIVCNPRDYLDENPAFNAQLVVESEMASDRDLAHVVQEPRVLSWKVALGLKARPANRDIDCWMSKASQGSSKSYARSQSRSRKSWRTTTSASPRSCGRTRANRVNKNW